MHPNAGQQLLGVEGLGDVVHRACLEQFHLVLHVPLGAEDDDGETLDFGQYLLPGQAGEHQIQQHQVGPLLREQVEGLGARVCPQHLIPFPAQQLLQDISNVDVVVNDGDGFHRAPPSRMVTDTTHYSDGAGKRQEGRLCCTKTGSQ